MTMLRRISSMTFLLASLFFAGLPAFTYADCVPQQDCCPNGPLGPCGIEGSAAAPSNDVQSCCASSPTASAAFVANASSNDFHKHPKRSHLPALLPFPAILPAAHLASIRSTVMSTKPFFSPSHALLYLSTGRLRL
jgi:hypothetical protein